MFAVVEDQQKLLTGKMFLQQIEGRAVNLGREFESIARWPGSPVLRSRYAAGQRRQFHQPDAIGKDAGILSPHQLHAGFDGQARLADTARTGECHQALGGDGSGRPPPPPVCARRNWSTARADLSCGQ